MFTKGQLDELVKEYDEQGLTKKDVAALFYVMFSEEKITLEELDNVVNALGFHLSEEFKAMSPESQRTEGFRLKEEKSETPVRGEDEEKVEDDKDDEDEEKKAMELFGK